MTITDATASGETLHSFTLDTLAERLSAREIIRARIYQEVQDYNRDQGQIFRGLVQPTCSSPSKAGGSASVSR